MRGKSLENENACSRTTVDTLNVKQDASVAEAKPPILIESLVNVSL